MPVVGIVLVLRPQLADIVLVAAGLTTAVLRRSYVRYQRLRWT
ncbi:hypothetical protein [Streptomyces atratus]